MKLIILPRLAIRPQGAHCRDRTRPDRQNRIRAGGGGAGPAQRRIFAHHAAEEAAGADPRQWRRHPRFLRHRRISRRTRRRRQADSGLGAGAMEGQERPFACCRACSIRCCCAATRKWCGRSRCAGRHGPTITGTAPGAAWRASRSRPDMLSRPLDIAQIALACVLGYADFRFADCGWRKAYPKLDAFHERMLSGLRSRSRCRRRPELRKQP